MGINQMCNQLTSMLLIRITLQLSTDTCFGITDRVPGINCSQSNLRAFTRTILLVDTNVSHVRVS